MKKNKTIQLFAIMVFILPLTAYALVNWFEKKYHKLPVYGPVKEVNGKKLERTAGDFVFTNQDNVITNNKVWDNKIIIANFFFTHCPVVCPKMMKNVQTVQDAFHNDNGVNISSFTVDPQRDSAAQLKLFSKRFHINSSNWQLFTGDKKELYRFARNEMMIVATDGDGGPTDFIHSDKLVLLDKQKRIRGYYDGTNKKEVNELIQDIKKLKNEK
jgi:protein SCO1/2